VYSKPGGKPLMLDLTLPKEGKGPYPAVLMFHGIGSFTNGRAGLRDHTFALAQNGFAVLAVGFRHESKDA
jgi:dienelactone hydrolase